MVNITHVNLLTLAASIPYANELYAIANASTEVISFLSYSECLMLALLVEGSKVLTPVLQQTIPLLPIS